MGIEIGLQGMIREIRQDGESVEYNQEKQIET
jgi:hypothetical protein